MKKKQPNKTKRLEPKVWKGIKYVIIDDVVKFHGEEYGKRFNYAFGVQTCPVIEKGGKRVGAIYYEDYLNTCDFLDFRKPIVWD